VNYLQLGSHGPQVSAIGLGTMGMPDMYGPADRAESIATIHAALDRGVTLLDTGDFYGMGHNGLPNRLERCPSDCRRSRWCKSSGQFRRTRRRASVIRKPNFRTWIASAHSDGSCGIM